MGDVLVVHADAAIRSERADRAGPVRAVDGVVAAREGERSNPHRIVRRAARDDVGDIGIFAPQILGRRPRRLQVLAGDRDSTEPLSGGSPDRDRIAQGDAVADDEVQTALGRLDDDRAGRRTGRKNATTSRARAAPVAPTAANTPTIMRRSDLTIDDLFAPDMDRAVAVFQGRSGAFAATRAD